MSSVTTGEDLADDLRQWIADKKRKGIDKLVTVPDGPPRILDRDLKAPGFRKART